MRGLLRRYRSQPILRQIRSLYSLSFSTASVPHAETAVAEQTQLQPPHLYNSLSFRVEPLPARTPLLFFGSSTLEYSDRIRHAHSYVWWDIWRRTLPVNAEWVWCLHDVVTNDGGWTKTWDALGFLPLDRILRTSKHIQSTIIPYIQGMIERGAAYKIATKKKGEQQVYCHVPSIRPSNRYGILAPSYTRTIRQYAHDEDSRLRDDRDFLLWETKGDPSTKKLVTWQSPWGQGTPTAAVASAALLEQHTLQSSPDHYIIRAGRADDKVLDHVHEMAIGDAAGSVVPSQHWVHTGVFTERTNSRSNDYRYASRDHRADIDTIQHDPSPKLRSLMLKKGKPTVAFRDVLRWWALQRTYYEPAAPFEYPATMQSYRAALRAVTHFLHAVDALPPTTTSPQTENKKGSSSALVQQFETAVEALQLWNSEDPEQQPPSIGGAIDDVVRKGQLVLADQGPTTTPLLCSAAQVLREVLRSVGFAPRVWKLEKKKAIQQDVRKQQTTQQRAIVEAIPVSTRAPTQQHSLPPERMFIDGLDYAGQFSAFDPSSGLPTHAAIDGKPLSNNQYKIFRQLHRKRQKQLDKLAHQRRRKIIREAERRRKEEEYQATRQPWRRGAAGRIVLQPPPGDDAELPRAPIQPLTKRQERLRLYRLGIRRKKQLHRRG